MTADDSDNGKDGIRKSGDLLPVPGELEATLIEELLSERLGALVPEPQKQEVTRVVHEVVASFSGPLPPPVDP